MSDFIDAHDIAIRNRVAVDGRVNVTVEDWNSLLTYTERLEQENAELRDKLNSMVDQFECDHNCEYEYKLIKVSKQLLNK